MTLAKDLYDEGNRQLKELITEAKQDLADIGISLDSDLRASDAALYHQLDVARQKLLENQSRLTNTKLKELVKHYRRRFLLARKQESQLKMLARRDKYLQILTDRGVSCE